MKRATGLIVLVLLAALTFYPLLFLVITSLKSTPQFFRYFWWFKTPFHFENYVSAYNEIKGLIFNSVLVSGVSAAGVVVVASMAAYVFSRYDFPARQFLFYVVISMLMVPGILTLVPSFLWVKRLGLLNSYWVLILPYVAGGQVFAIFVMRGFFAGLPEELFESARIDGAGHFAIYRHIVLPLSKPVVGIVAIMNILSTWNNFLWPFITCPSSKYHVITNGLYIFAAQTGMRYGELAAGYLISAGPLLLLFMFTTRAFIRGVASGAFKA